ncbi:unnamed protein product [Cuscuta campestris]|uniref:Acyl-CoA thioesterase II domain-containing protein n=1 Tax=Cuscuta campestris TaxID=132261 RepID=A0A484NDL4_9ASTE|nr:unnamed protein product [Cuscuta campestris]
MGKKGPNSREGSGGVTFGSSTIRHDWNARKPSHVNPKLMVKVDHMKNLAVWASGVASIPPLSTFFGTRLAAYSESLGLAPDPSLVSCQRPRIISSACCVIALTKLTCLVLRHEHCNLLQPKSIWNADKAVDKCPLVEHILHLVPLEVNIFQCVTLPDAPKFGKVFGGQFMGQALAAATKTVNCLKIVHSIRAHFLLGGDVDIPIIYEVHRVRDGKSFSTRRVDAIQKGNVVFTLVASFQKEEGFDHQDALMPNVQDPETLLSMEEIRERRLTDHRLPRTYRNILATVEFVPWPIEIRFCDPSTGTSQTKSPPSLRFWFRAKGNLSDDQALHRCVVAYASDLIFASVSNNPHRKAGLKIATLSLDNS